MIVGFVAGFLGGIAFSAVLWILCEDPFFDPVAPEEDDWGSAL